METKLVQNYENSKVGLSAFQYDESEAGRNFSVSPELKTEFPGSKTKELFFHHRGNGMSPVYQAGEIMMCREFKDWRIYLPYGEVYLIVTKEFQTVRYVKSGSNESTFLLAASNPNFEDFEIPKHLILKIFLIIGSISRNII